MNRGDAEVTELRRQIMAMSGGYLRNLVTDGTCSRCYTPIADTGRCSRCRRDDLVDGLPDARGFLIYAGHDEPLQQAGRVMRDYKAMLHPSANAERTVTLLAALALRGHRLCPGRLVGASPTAWAAVPSLPDCGPQVHPLTRILRTLAKPGSIEIVLRGVNDPDDPRRLTARHFTVRSRIPDGAHVLLIDDTWTSGGHAQSATLALRAAGAAHVSLLVIARWLSVGWGATSADWMRSQLAGADYNPDICPWTQGLCPT